VATGTDVLAERTERLEEALRLSWRLQPSPGALALPCRLMGVLRTVVRALVFPLLRAREDGLESWPVAAKLIRHGDARLVGGALNQSLQEGYGRLLVASFLHQDVQLHPVGVDGTP
jgi:hypothetical protein